MIFYDENIFKQKDKLKQMKQSLVKGLVEFFGRPDEGATGCVA